jgi:hypothetical protein
MILFILLFVLLLCLIGMIDTTIEVSDEYHRQKREARKEGDDK